jgi:hypothetical protein
LIIVRDKHGIIINIHTAKGKNNNKKQHTAAFLDMRGLYANGNKYRELHLEGSDGVYCIHF